MSHAARPEENTRALLLSEFGERFRRYRLSVPEADKDVWLVSCGHNGDGTLFVAGQRTCQGF